MVAITVVQHTMVVCWLYRREESMCTRTSTYWPTTCMVSTATPAQKTLPAILCQITPRTATEETTSLQTSHLALATTISTTLLMLPHLELCGEPFCHPSRHNTQHPVIVQTVTTLSSGQPGIIACQKLHQFWLPETCLTARYNTWLLIKLTPKGVVPSA